MGKSKYTVALTDDQRSFLEDLVHRRKSSASAIQHAYILPMPTNLIPRLPSFSGVISICAQRPRSVCHGEVRCSTAPEVSRRTSEPPETGQCWMSRASPDRLQQTTRRPVPLDATIACRSPRGIKGRQYRFDQGRRAGAKKRVPTAC